MGWTGWTYLCIAGVLETVWIIGIRYTVGFSRPLPSLLTVLTMGASFYFLAQAVKTVPLGTAYAVWTGIGATGAVLVGMVLFAESRDALRLVCIGLIVAGVAGLRLVANDG